MQELRDIASRLLSSSTVQVVIGYAEGPRGVRPCFAKTPQEAERLIFDPRCVHNLAVYLSPRRTHVARLGRVAVAVKACDARAVAGLLRENQLRREDVVLIGLRCGGVLRHPESQAELTRETLADRCSICEEREPSTCDYLVGEQVELPQTDRPREQHVAELMEMSASERWSFWKRELSRCVRCNACRQVCPLCFCEVCIADKTQPTWIESSPHLRGNVAWHITRAMHLAGRCVDCAECERACPVGIPLGLLTRFTARVVEKRFQHKPTEDSEVPAPLGTYRVDDDQEFIL